MFNLSSFYKLQNLELTQALFATIPQLLEYFIDSLMPFQMSNLISNGLSKIISHILNTIQNRAKMLRNLS